MIKTAITGISDGRIAHVGPSRCGDHGALCVGIGGIANDVYIPTFSAPIGDVYEAYLTLDNDGTTKDMAVNGSVTPQEFSISAIDDYDLLINEIIITGTDSLVKPEKFLNENELSNGIVLDARSKNQDIEFSVIFKTTMDIGSFSSQGGFSIWTGTGKDAVLGYRQFCPPFILRASGKFGPENDDFVRATINDNLTGLVSFNINIRAIKVEADLI